MTKGWTVYAGSHPRDSILKSYYKVLNYLWFLISLEEHLESEDPFESGFFYMDGSIGKDFDIGKSKKAKCQCCELTLYFQEDKNP